jgi:hypothetical protein
MSASLSLTPWGLRDGASASLSNHPAGFPDREVRRAGRALGGMGLGGLPSASELAPRVVDALDRHSGEPFIS